MAFSSGEHLQVDLVHATIAGNHGRAVTTVQQGASLLTVTFRGSILQGPAGSLNGSGTRISRGYNIWSDAASGVNHATASA